jgi:sec-independent protein translocase protein TatA
MPNIGVWEIVIVVVIALLVFGPKKLPELGSSLGRTITGFKKSLKETKDEVETTTGEDVTAATTTDTAAAAPAATTASAATTATPAATQPAADAATETTVKTDTL